MAGGTTLNVRVNSALQDHIAMQLGEHGLYENASEYVRDLIRRDKKRREGEVPPHHAALLKGRLETPLSEYRESTAEDAIARGEARWTAQEQT
ncbi:MAG: addiction module antitoxin [Pacificimonas sp.]